MIPASLYFASLVSIVCIMNLKREKSCILVAESVSGLVTSLLARSCAISSLVANRACELGEAVVGLGKGGACVGDWDGDKLHLPPYVFEGGEKGGVRVRLLLELDVASEVPTKSDLNDKDVALLSVEGARVQRGYVRDSLSAYEVGGCPMSFYEEGVWYLVG